MESAERLFEVKVAFTSGTEEALVNNEVGAVIPFSDNEEFAAKIAAGELVEVTAHVVTEEDIATNPDAGLVIGDVIHLPLVVAEEKPVEQAVEEAAPAVEAAPVEEAATAQIAGPTYVYAGKVVVRDSTRVVEGREYHHVTLATGESLDITDEEHATMLANPQ